MGENRYHATLTCDGLTEAEGASALMCVSDEFKNRPWQQNVVCRWENDVLYLEADNDCDKEGKALLDEFRDVVISCVRTSGEIKFNIVSVRRVEE
jgi:hypothetical protein